MQSRRDGKDRLENIVDFGENIVDFGENIFDFGENIVDFGEYTSNKSYGEIKIILPEEAFC